MKSLLLSIWLTSVEALETLPIAVPTTSQTLKNDPTFSKQSDRQKTIKLEYLPVITSLARPPF